MVPCYNEQEVVGLTAGQLVAKLAELKTAGHIAPNSRALLVDDGSTDATWEIVCQLAREHNAVCGLRLQQNYGQQVALYAGMLEAVAQCDVAITLDADGQHDLGVVEEMLCAYSRGSEVVYAVKANPQGDPLWKRLTGRTYYRLLALWGTKTFKNHADYRLVSAQAICLLETMPRRSVFLRSDFPKLGLPSAVVHYECKPRAAGKSKYSLGKMLSLARDGFASTSSGQHASTIDFAIIDRV